MATQILEHTEILLTFTVASGGSSDYPQRHCLLYRLPRIILN